MLTNQARKNISQQTQEMPHHPVPLRWLLVEVNELVRLFRDYYMPRDGYPGLISAGPLLPDDLDRQLLTLRKNILETQQKYVQLLAYEKNPSAQMEEAEEILDELITALEWYAVSRRWATSEPGKENETEMNQQVVDEDVDTPEKMARALFEYASIAGEIRSDIEGIGDFDGQIIDRAFEVVNNIVDMKTQTVPLTTEAQTLLAQREQYMAECISIIELLRAAASLVFRRFPQIVKKFSSRRVPIQNVAEYRSNKIARTYNRQKNRKNIPLRYLP